MDEPVHDWFELSYSSYFVLPRSILQSLPTDLQQQFIDAVEAIEGYYDHRACIPHKGSYRVYLKDEQGRFMHDPFQDYERGRRRISKEYVKEACCAQRIT